MRQVAGIPNLSPAPCWIMKLIFGFEKNRYRGLRMNRQRLCVNFGSVSFRIFAVEEWNGPSQAGAYASGPANAWNNGNVR